MTRIDWEAVGRGLTDVLTDVIAADTWAPVPTLPPDVPHPEWARIADPYREALIANRVRRLTVRGLVYLHGGRPHG